MDVHDNIHEMGMIKAYITYSLKMLLIESIVIEEKKDDKS